MQVRMDYGKTGLMVELPDENLKAVLEIKDANPLLDPINALHKALESPIGSHSLSELAKGKSRACIVICDITRPVPNELLLKPILAALEQAGLKAHQICLLIATGTHRPNLGDELIHLVGHEIATRYECINHMF